MDNCKLFCRLCLKTVGNCNIFENNLFSDINTITGILMAPSDNLPQRVCINCVKIIRNAIELRILANQSDLYLKSMITRKKNDQTNTIVSEGVLKEEIDIHEHEIGLSNPLYDQSDGSLLQDTDSNLNHTSADGENDIIVSQDVFKTEIDICENEIGLSNPLYDQSDGCLIQDTDLNLNHTSADGENISSLSSERVTVRSDLYTTYNPILPMPRLKKLAWSPHEMKLAMEAVASGLKLRKAAAQFGVPVSSLHDHLKKGPEYQPRLGQKPVFTSQQEAEIQEKLIMLSKIFYGLTPHDSRKAVFQYAEKNNIKHPFNREKAEAGKDWFCGFLKRNPKVPEATTAFNQQEMDIFFNKLLSLLKKYTIPPNRIFNVDETGVLVHKPGKIVTPKGQKQVDATSWEKGKNITICCCMSATGQFIPPLFIFPCIRLTPALEKGGPTGSVYRCSKTGWMNEEIFLDWLKLFMEHAKPSLEDVVLLILDNHSSHISIDIYEFCRENGVLMLSVPPHTSHHTQPLHLSFFGPLKLQYHKECNLFMKTNNVKLTPYEIAPLFSKAYFKAATPEIAVKGFADASIWPMNPDKFADHYSTPMEPIDQLIVELGKTNNEIVESTSTRSNFPATQSSTQVFLGDVKDLEEGGNNFSFVECSPAPSPKKSPEVDKDIRKGKRSKQDSDIVTTTPIKKALEIKNKIKKRRNI